MAQILPEKALNKSLDCSSIPSGKPACVCILYHNHTHTHPHRCSEVLSPAFKKTLCTSPYLKKREDALLFAPLAASLNHLRINTKYVESKIKTTSPLQRSFLNTDVLSFNKLEPTRY
jgi:hypothetical protein